VLSRQIRSLRITGISSKISIAADCAFKPESAVITSVSRYPPEIEGIKTVIERVTHDLTLLGIVFPKSKNKNKLRHARIVKCAAKKKVYISQAFQEARSVTITRFKSL
jgi:hypothetical protein